jgi:carboxylate-amine ligase
MWRRYARRRHRDWSYICGRSGHRSSTRRWSCAPRYRTLVEDALAIVALYRTTVWHLCSIAGATPISTPCNALVVENKWRAQRYGVHGTFVTQQARCRRRDARARDRGHGGNTAALGCAAEVAAAALSSVPAPQQTSSSRCTRRIAQASRDTALRAVTDWIAAATLQ